MEKAVTPQRRPGVQVAAAGSRTKPATRTGPGTGRKCAIAEIRVGLHSAEVSKRISRNPHARPDSAIRQGNPVTPRLIPLSSNSSGKLLPLWESLHSPPILLVSFDILWPRSHIGRVIPC